MTSESLKLVACALLEEELTARRYSPSARRTVQDAVKAFLRWSSQRGTGNLAALRPADLMAYRSFLSRQVSR